MNPFRKLRSWFRGPTDPETIAEAQRLSDDRDTIRISQNIPMSQIGGPTNVPPTSDVLHPGKDGRN